MCAHLPRLSVDLDLNYVGAVDRDAMAEERPRLEDAVRAVARENGYEPEDIRRSHASWTVRLLYEDARGQRASIKLDINFLMRVPLYGVERRELPHVFELDVRRVPCLVMEDVLGGKLNAMAVRAEPRDVFDAARLFSHGSAHDLSRLRKAFLFYAFMDDASLSTVDLGAVRSLGAREYRERLYPMLRRGELPKPGELAAVVLPRVEEMLRLEHGEVEFGRSLERGVYEPGLLFSDTGVSGDIARHPAAEWRRLHPHGRLPDGA